MPTFNDSENLPPFIPEGDYIFTVTGYERRISQGAKTAGADVYALTLAFDGGGRVFSDLIDTPALQFKIDTFLKSAGIRLAKGEAFYFDQDEANANNARFINPIGLRGWCRLSIEEYKGIKRNKVAIYYTNLEKLAPVKLETASEEEIPF